MSKLIFYYGTMGCSKTANALMTRFQYQDRGKRVWLIKPAIDNRDDTVDERGIKRTLIKSRVGISAEAQTISTDENIYNTYFLSGPVLPEVIICDEAQFLTGEQVEQLKDISSTMNIDILCYGLRTDFRTRLFPGAARLFELADRTVELDNVCECGQPALVNARLNAKGEVLIKGAQVEIGGDEKYKALCWSCYKRKIQR